MAGVLLAVMGVATSCQQKANNVPVSVAEIQQPAPDLSVVQVDSVVVDTVWAVSDKEVLELAGDDAKPGFQAVIDVPSEAQSPLLANAVMEWMSEVCMGGCYDGDMMDVRAMVAACIRNQQTRGGATSGDYMVERSIRKVYENKNVVTFVCEGYDYMLGAAHGMPYQYGATFRKSDGKIFGWNMLRSAADLQPFLNRGLKKYFEADSDEQLTEELMVDEVYSATYIPKATTAPWLTAEGINIVYQPYEIASYAAGMPAVTIPLKDAQSVLTPTAARLFAE